MDKIYKTEQEYFWAGEFGNEYIKRNTSENLLPSYLNLWSEIISKTSDIKSCLEFGANIGVNLQALKLLIPDLDMHAVEINETACNEHLAKFMDKANICNQSILEYKTDKKYDLVYTNGVLIHINPNELNSVYEKMYQSSAKYILISEYYNPTPVSVTYRGNENKLFKRDFAGEMMDKYPELKLVDYGFRYHRDNNFKSDDDTWFLLEK